MTKTENASTEGTELVRDLEVGGDEATEVVGGAHDVWSLRRGTCA